MIWYAKYMFGSFVYWGAGGFRKDEVQDTPWSFLGRACLVSFGVWIYAYCPDWAVFRWLSSSLYNLADL